MKTRPNGLARLAKTIRFENLILSTVRRWSYQLVSAEESSSRLMGREGLKPRDQNLICVRNVQNPCLPNPTKKECLHGYIYRWFFRHAQNPSLYQKIPHTAGFVDVNFDELASFPASKLSAPSGKFSHKGLFDDQVSLG